MNPDIQDERLCSSLNTEELAAILHKDRTTLERKRDIEHMALSDPDLDVPEACFQSREEAHHTAVGRDIKMFQKIEKLGLKDEDRIVFINAALRHRATALSMQYVAFMPAVERFATPQQLQRWDSGMRTLQVIGNYAQTELGHGTNVRALQTTATYEPVTREFVLNTPSMTAAKWWPGSLAYCSNYSLVMANLIIFGKSHGLHAFMVPIRNSTTNQTLPGVELGEIGPKFGAKPLLNGYMVLSNVRIPRDNMLMKYAEVLEDGTFVSKSSPKLMYGSMLQLRSQMCKGAAILLAKAVTIAIRYSAVRRQSELEPGSPESKIMEFRTQQEKLFPQLALAYASWITSDRLQSKMEAFSKQAQSGDFSSLAEMHSLSAGLKAYYTHSCSAAVETCRMSCGGHGYSESSGFPTLYTELVGNVTAEGEKTVLFLQTARYLIKSYAASITGNNLDPSVSYLRSAFTSGAISVTQLPGLIETFQRRAKRLIESCAGMVERDMTSGVNDQKAFYNAAVELEKATTVHCQLFTLTTFYDFINTTLCETGVIYNALCRLCQLYAVSIVLQDTGDFLQFALITPKQLQQLREIQVNLLAELRPDAVKLVDAFDFQDKLLVSVLGRYDGNVYNNLYKWAQQSTLNKSEVDRSFGDYLRPFRQSSML